MPLPIHTRRPWAILMILATSGLGACKQMKSNAKSVDALLNQDALSRDKRECGPVAATDPKAPPEQQQLARVYAAVPAKLKTWFSIAKKDYVVDPDETTCAAFLTAKAGDNPIFKDRVVNVQSCWLKDVRDDAVEDDQGKVQTVKMSVPVIHVTQDARAIHRNLLPMTVYAFAEFYVDGVMGHAVDQTQSGLDKDSPRERALRSFISVFRSARAQLTNDFVDELDARSDHKAVLDAYTNFYKQDKDTLKKNPLFQNFVIAEFVDAYYCSPASRGEFVEKGLPKTKGAFAYFIDAFGAPWKL